LRAGNSNSGRKTTIAKSKTTKNEMKKTKREKRKENILKKTAARVSEAIAIRRIAAGQPEILFIVKNNETKTWN
jgi:hypothetical protein